jgi:hypothetical protein
MRESAPTVREKVSALEARLRRFARVRAVAWNVAAATVAFVAVASRIGTTAPEPVVAAAWVVVVASGLGAFFVAYGLLPGLVERLRAMSLRLPMSRSALTSALEFESDTARLHSDALAAAHVRRVAKSLDEVDEDELLPASRLATRPATFALVVAFTVFFAARTDEAVREGARTMFGHDAAEVAVVASAARTATGPAVQWVSPTEGREIDELEVVALKVRVTDERSPIAEATLVVFVPGGRERRVPIPIEGKDAFARSVELETSFIAASFGARQGARLAVRVEAKSASSDALGRSPTLRFTVRRSGPLRRTAGAPLKALRDELVDRLGDRLAPSPPSAVAAMRTREAGLERPFRELATHSKEAATAIRAAASQASPSAALTAIEAVVTSIEAALSESARLKRTGTAPRLLAFDARTVTLLEDLTLRLDDLIVQSALRDAGESSRDLRDMQQEMRRLLDEMRRSPNEQTRRELLNAIREMRAAMRELAETLSELQTAVPTEYTNADADDARSMGSMLDDLERSLESGDLDGAERALAGLDRQSSELDESLREGRQSFARERGTSGDEAGDESASGDEREGDGPSERVDLDALRGQAGAAERRRRLLEALGKPTDPLYREATREYLEGRLR